MIMKYDMNVKLGDVLTTLTIIISVIALLISWSKDRITRETEMADRIRSASAYALTSLDRWQLHNMSLYDELQPIYVETSEMLSDDFNLIKARDFLWKKINEQKTIISRNILEEKIKTSYFDLLSHFPDTRNQFQGLFNDLDSIEENISHEFLSESESNILHLDSHRDKYTSAMLGNALRNTSSKYQIAFKKQTNSAIEPVRDFLFEIISKSNNDILRVRRE